VTLVGRLWIRDEAGRPARRWCQITSLAICLFLSGCAPSALESARAKLRKGDYVGAHQELVALEANPDKLGVAERREVKDDLCITEFTIGPPSFSLREQRRTCAEAITEAGSESGEVLTRIDKAIEQADDERIEAAIRAGDLAAAEAAVEDYETLPGANQIQVARWSNRMWKLVELEDSQSPRGRKAVLASAIVTLKREHAELTKLSDAAFKRWVIKTATVNGKTIVYDPRPDHGLLKLDLMEPDLASAALNLDKFAEINDAVVARCGCNGRTEIGVGTGDLPAYVVRLDPENRRSEVLILLTGAHIGSRVSMR